MQVTMTEVPKLSVVIVTWNVRELVPACLDALFAETRGLAIEVIVVDNASTDQTVETVRVRYPAVRVVANEINVGFPRANNQGIAQACGDYILFLNPDTEVGPGSVRACVAALDADAAVGVVGCKLVFEDGTTQAECARRPYLLRHLAMELLYLHMLFPRSRVFGDHLLGHWDHEGERDVEAISGAFMLCRRSVVEQTGGLPDDVFMYHEDLAFCLRVRRAGSRIRYLGQVSTLHRFRGSSRKSSQALALLEGESKLRLIRDAQGPAAAAAGRALFGVRCALRLVGGGLGSLLLGRTSLAARYPRVFDWRTHGLQLVWTLAPWIVEHRVPRPPERGTTSRPLARSG
jgi:GT2 family glycosyltransferase